MPVFNSYHLKSMFLCEELNSNPLGGKKPSPLADIYHYEQEDYVCPTAVACYAD